MENHGIARQDQEFLGQIMRFINLDAIDNKLKQKFIERPSKIDLTSILKKALAPQKEEIANKFLLVAQFKVTIPANYDSKNYEEITDELKKYNITYSDTGVNTDKTFNKINQKLIPGETYLVKTWMVNPEIDTTFEEILTLLKNAYLTGINEMLILLQKNNEFFIKNSTYLNFNKSNDVIKINFYDYLNDEKTDSNYNSSDKRIFIVGFYDLEQNN